MTEPLYLYPLFPWKRISFFSELRTKEEFEKDFKENWDKTLEKKAIASSLSKITNEYKSEKFQTYIVEKENKKFLFYMFIPMVESDICPIDVKFIEEFKTIYEPYGIMCSNIEYVYINHYEPYFVKMYYADGRDPDKRREFCALEFSFTYKEESTD